MGLHVGGRACVYLCHCHEKDTLGAAQRSQENEGYVEQNQTVSAVDSPPTYSQIPAKVRGCPALCTHMIKHSQGQQSCHANPCCEPSVITCR